MVAVHEHTSQHTVCTGTPNTLWKQCDTDVTDFFYLNTQHITKSLLHCVFVSGPYYNQSLRELVNYIQAGMRW